jgi:hypothetical protein
MSLSVKSVFIFLLLTLLGSCSQQKESQVFEKLQEANQLILADDDLTADIAFQTVFTGRGGSEKLLVSYNENKHSLIVTDVEKKEVISKIQLQRQGAEQFGDIRAVCLLPNRQLAILSREYFGGLDRSGKVLTHRFIAAGATDGLTGIDPFDYHLNSSIQRGTNMVFHEQSNSIIFRLNYYKYYSSDFVKYFAEDVMLFCKYDLTKEKFSYLPLHYPQEVRECLSSSLSTLRYTMKGNELIYWFKGFSTIYAYDLVSKEQQVIHQDIPFFSNRPTPYQGSLDDFNEVQDHSVYFTHYMDMVVDEVNNRIYQFVLNPVENLRGLKPYYIRYNGNFEFEGYGEIPASNRTFGGFATDGKLFLPIVDSDEDVLSYGIY